MKVGKEEICALVAAIERFMAGDERAELAEYTRRATCLAEALAGIEGIRPQVLWPIRAPARWCPGCTLTCNPVSR